MNQASVGIADHPGQGELMRLVAGGLAENGLHVRYPEREGERCLTITDIKGVWCTLSVGDTGYVEWECSGQVGADADPKQIADVVTALLTGRAAHYERLGHGYDMAGVTLKGIVGIELQARGLAVDLEVYKDDNAFDAVAEIVVTNPDTRENGQVRITDDGVIEWEHDYWPDYAATTWEPEYTARLADVNKIARDVVATVKQAMFVVVPELAELTNSDSHHARAGRRLEAHGSGENEKP